jgi:hypothetical protein
MRDALDRIKGTHGRTLLDRIGSCHVAAVDPDFKGFRALGVSLSDRPQTPVSDVQLCEEVRASLMQDAPSDRAFQAFKAHPTKKNHCDFLLEVSNTEQAIINRFERASVNCGSLDWLKTQHAKTLETQTKIVRCRWRAMSHMAAAPIPDFRGHRLIGSHGDCACHCHLRRRG